MRHRKVKKTSNFKKGLKIYAIILAILCFTFLVYVLNTLYQYEASFTDNYMTDVLKDFSRLAQKGKFSEICNTNEMNVNSLEKSNLSYNETFKHIFKTTDISFRKSDKSTANEPVYDILSNNQAIITVKLSIKKNEKRLGLFTYPVWQVADCNVSSERGIYYYDIEVPSDYIVEINGTKLNEKYISETIKNESYVELSKYAELPDIVNYKVDNFIMEPDIKIMNNKGEIVSYIEKNHKLEINNSYLTAKSYDEIKNNIAKEIDILEIAENWSLFLTNDLKGEKHGFYTFRKYLIKNSNFYNMAYAWATSIDITFVSSHTLKNPTFTNTSVTDFIVYNENAFSCVVKLEKNMRIANGKDKVDTMSDRLYFVYYDDPTDNIDGPTWKLVDMKSAL